MILDKFISDVKGAFSTGPLHALAEKVASVVDNEPAGEQLHVETTEDFRELYKKHRHLHAGQRDSFLFALLVLADYVFSADSTSDAAEKRFIAGFLRENFGRFAERQGERILESLGEERRRLCLRDRMLYIHMVGECSRQLTYAMTYDQRLQLLGFLMMIAKVSNGISEKESDALRDLTIYLKMRPDDFYSLLNLYDDSIEGAYKLLEVTAESTDEEVLAAFERMKENHNPERMLLLGDDIGRLAQMKFLRIIEARDRIYLARGIQPSTPEQQEEGWDD